MKPKTILTGQIDLCNLVNVRCESVRGQECILIPIEANPTISATTTRNGNRKAYLNIAIKECPENGFGNTHFIEASIHDANKESLCLTKQELRKYAPVIGNLKACDVSKSKEDAITVTLTASEQRRIIDLLFGETENASVELNTMAPDEKNVMQSYIDDINKLIKKLSV